MRPCVIFDIDGTLSDVTHRLHLLQRDKPDWDAFYDAAINDAPIAPMVTVHDSMHPHNDIFYVTGRVERIRNQTAFWLAKHLSIGYAGNPSLNLFMRADGDHRHDEIIKEEALGLIRAMGYNPTLAFEDRKRVVNMWRRNGILCAQVAEGDF